MLRIKELCAKNETTLLALSKKIGITQPALSRIVNGVTKPNLETLERIADGLGVPVSALFGDAPEPFLAIVRKNGQTFTFEDEGELRNWLCLGIPLIDQDKLPQFFAEHKAREEQAIIHKNIRGKEDYSGE